MHQTKHNNLKTLFTGMVHAVPSSCEGMFAMHEGVVVNAASCSLSREDFFIDVAKALDEYELNLIDISDIKIVSERAIPSYKKHSMRKTLNEALVTNNTAFEIFYTYDK